MKCYVFVYGTLCDVKVRKEVIGYDTPSYPASISGFRLSEIFLNEVCYPVLEPDPAIKEPINGVLFAINEEDLQKIDCYESEAYRRLQVDTKKGIKAWMYIKNES